MAQLTPIPNFSLYGEGSAIHSPAYAHIETIAARSALHNWEIAPHRHAVGIQLLLVQAGQVTATLDGLEVVLDGPCFVLIPPGAVHGFRFVPDTSGHVLTLSTAFAARSLGPDDPLLQLLTLGAHGAIAAEAAARCAWLAGELLALAHDWQAPNPLFQTLAEALVRSLGAGRARSAGDQPDDVRLARFRQLVAAHLRERWPVAAYAQALGVTQRTLSRLCAERLGTSPLDFINRRCAIEAQRLLRYTNASVVQVAADLGFVDPSYFSRFYLRMTGSRPQIERR